MKQILFLLLAALCSLQTVAQNLSATEIIRRADANRRGNSSYSEMKMTIVRPTWQHEIAFKAWSKGSDYSLAVITAPAKEKGQAFLKRQKELWNWQPTIGRMIKMSSSVMSQSWMGSDFTNDDLMRESSVVEDYTHHLDGSETVRGSDCYKLTLMPREEAAVVWGKVVMWVSKDRFVEIRSEFYDEDAVLVNVIDGYDIKQFGQRYLPSRMEVVPADKPQQKTVMDVLKYEFDQPIDDSFFSQQNMKRNL